MTRRSSRYLILSLTAAAAAIAVYAISAAPSAPAGKPSAAAPATVHQPARFLRRWHTMRRKSEEEFSVPAPLEATSASLSASKLDAPPSASEFATDVVSTTTAYANANGERARIANVHCVQASSGHYMCSYAVVRPGRARECHLMQATWTPNRASTYTVTLAGRTHACGSVREAVRSLD